MVKIFLNRIRTERKMSARTLSYLSGVSKTHIINIENGKNSPTIECLCKLSQALDVDIYELFSCQGENSEE